MFETRAARVPLQYGKRNRRYLRKEGDWNRREADIAH
jgi:hypothetical protein